MAQPCVRPFVTSHAPAVQPLHAQDRRLRVVVCPRGGGQLPAILGAGAGPLPGAVHGTLTPHGAARPRGRASRGEEPGRELSREEGRASCHYLCDLPRGRYCYLYFCSLGSQAAAASWPREGEGWPKNTKHLQLGTECRVGL